VNGGFPFHYYCGLKEGGGRDGKGNQIIPLRFVAHTPRIRYDQTTKHHLPRKVRRREGIKKNHGFG
jgi:ATP adenylyltransferase/5',5'''-P-1,P-4-tetraphosphate phosphorylase II